MTNSTIIRHQVTQLPIAQSIIDQVHRISNSDGMPKGLKIDNRYGIILYDSAWLAGVDYDQDNEEWSDETYVADSDSSHGDSIDDELEDEYDRVDPDEIAELTNGGRFEYGPEEDEASSVDVGGDEEIAPNEQEDDEESDAPSVTSRSEEDNIENTPSTVEEIVQDQDQPTEATTVELLSQLNELYGKLGPVTATRGDRHDYLAMVLSFSTPGKLQRDMRDYIEQMVSEFSERLSDTETEYPWNERLFQHKEGTLTVEITFVNKIHFFVTLSCKLKQGPSRLFRTEKSTQ